MSGFDDLTTEELVNILEDENKRAVGHLSDDVSVDQDSNLDRYLGRPYGDEEEGVSHAMSMDVAEVVDWALPDLLEPFISGDLIAEFEPSTMADDAYATLVIVLRRVKQASIRRKDAMAEEVAVRFRGEPNRLGRAERYGNAEPARPPCERNPLRSTGTQRDIVTSRRQSDFANVPAFKVEQGRGVVAEIVFSRGGETFGQRRRCDMPRHGERKSRSAETYQDAAPVKLHG